MEEEAAVKESAAVSSTTPPPTTRTMRQQHQPLPLATAIVPTTPMLDQDLFLQWARGETTSPANASSSSGKSSFGNGRDRSSSFRNQNNNNNSSMVFDRSGVADAPSSIFFFCNSSGTFMNVEWPRRF